MDGLGNPLAFLLSSGNDHDSIHAVPLLNQIDIAGSNILGDKAYGARAIREYIDSQGELPIQSRPGAMSAIHGR